MNIPYPLIISKFISKYSFYISISIIILLVISETIGQFFLNKSTNNMFYFIYGAIIYAVAGILYGILLKTGIGLAIANTAWQATQILAITLIGVFYFKEKLSRKQILGIALVMIGSILLA